MQQYIIIHLCNRTFQASHKRKSHTIDICKLSSCCLTRFSAGCNKNNQRISRELLCRSRGTSLCAAWHANVANYKEHSFLHLVLCIYIYSWVASIKIRGASGKRENYKIIIQNAQHVAPEPRPPKRRDVCSLYTTLVITRRALFHSRYGTVTALLRFRLFREEISCDSGFSCKILEAFYAISHPMSEHIFFPLYLVRVT